MRPAIYDVDDGGANYWVLARGPAEAVDCLIRHLKSVDQWEEPEEGSGYPSATVVPPDKVLTFHADEKAIAHTAEDWLVIYRSIPISDPDLCVLACSEW